MSRINTWPLLFLLSLTFFAACTRTEVNEPGPVGSASPSSSVTTAEGPPADIVKASAQPVELAPGREVLAFVTVKIAEGYHVNGNPSTRLQIPTTLTVDGVLGITPGTAVYPPSVSKKFSFSPDPIMVYEAEVVIKQPLKASADVAKGDRSLHAKLRVQPCDDTVCYPPRNLDVAIPVSVK